LGLEDVQVRTSRFRLAEISLNFSNRVEEHYLEEQDSDERLIDTVVLSNPNLSISVKEWQLFRQSTSSSALRYGIVLPNIGLRVSS
jgi:hypothetical protein